MSLADCSAVVNFGKEGVPVRPMLPNRVELARVIFVGGRSSRGSGRDGSKGRR